MIIHGRQFLFFTVKSHGVRVWRTGKVYKKNEFCEDELE